MLSQLLLWKAARGVCVCRAAKTACTNSGGVNSLTILLHPSDDVAIGVGEDNVTLSSILIGCRTKLEGHCSPSIYAKGFQSENT